MLELIKRLLSEIETDRDKEFFKRVWSIEPEIYKNRLRAIGFEKLNSILDAGCGFGQWSVRLAELNELVEGIELDETRVRLTKIISDYLKKKNLNVHTGSITNLPFKTNTFDGIFSYSVIYYTDFRLSLNEFFRVLKPGGKLYFCTNDYGWYLFNLIENHNPARDFSPRKIALETFWNTWKYYLTSNMMSGKEHILTKNNALKILKKIGYRNIQWNKDGGINFKKIPIESFYSKKKYGLTNVYEVLCEK